MTEISPTKSSESARPVVLVCQCSDAQVTETAATERLVAVLGKRDATVNVVSDLCELAALNPDALRALATTGPVWVVACHRRAVGALLSRAGVDGLPSQVRLVDLCGVASDDVDALVDAQLALPPGEAVVTRRERGSTWPAWYPLIDPDRCSNCHQCQDFCLFGVYSQDAEGRVRVTHPANCKNNCPACARICPEVAIIFPKVGQEPYDGAAIADEAAARADAKTQRSAVLSNDVYEGLKRRQGSAKRRLLADES